MNSALKIAVNLYAQLTLAERAIDRKSRKLNETVARLSHTDFNTYVEKTNEIDSRMESIDLRKEKKGDIIQSV